MYLWTQESDKSWDCGMVMAEICILVPWVLCDHYPNQVIFLSLVGDFPIHLAPSMARKGEMESLGIQQLPFVGGDFSPLLSAAVFQLSLRGIQYSCLTASFLRCRLNEKEKKKKLKTTQKQTKTPNKTNKQKIPTNNNKKPHQKQHNKKQPPMGIISNGCYLSLKGSVLLSGQSVSLGAPYFGKSHASWDAASWAAVNSFKLMHSS